MNYMVAKAPSLKNIPREVPYQAEYYKTLIIFFQGQIKKIPDSWRAQKQD